jgi:hypothetical protein
MTSGEFQQLSGCKNGNCPKIYRKGDRAVVQGLSRPAPVAPHPRGEEVEIPMAVLLEAATALLVEVAGSDEAPGLDQHVAVLGDRVLVRGSVETDLTMLIPAPRGETVVEIPTAALVLALRSLEAA